LVFKFKKALSPQSTITADSSCLSNTAPNGKRKQNRMGKK
jgi:hypothetical protein